jgi:hypothetical protein
MREAANSERKAHQRHTRSRAASRQRRGYAPGAAPSVKKDHARQGAQGGGRAGGKGCRGRGTVLGRAGTIAGGMPGREERDGACHEHNKWRESQLSGDPSEGKESVGEEEEGEGTVSPLLYHGCAREKGGGGWACAGGVVAAGPRRVRAWVHFSSFL